jgi:hypothetical protein
MARDHNAALSSVHGGYDKRYGLDHTPSPRAGIGCLDSDKWS